MEVLPASEKTTGGSRGRVAAAGRDARGGRSAVRHEERMREKGGQHATSERETLQGWLLADRIKGVSDELSLGGGPLCTGASFRYAETCNNFRAALRHEPVSVCIGGNVLPPGATPVCVLLRDCLMSSGRVGARCLSSLAFYGFRYVLPYRGTVDWWLGMWGGGMLS